jgi:hypothetical protein
MPTTPFETRHRDRAFRETRSAAVTGDASLTAREHGFLQHCRPEERCACRRVLVQAIGADTGSRIGATIGFGCEPRACYPRRAAGDGRVAPEMTDVSLDPLDPRGRYSTAHRAGFRPVIQDAEHVRRLLRHHALHEAISAPASDEIDEVLSASPLASRVPGREGLLDADGGARLLRQQSARHARRRNLGAEPGKRGIAPPASPAQPRPAPARPGQARPAPPSPGQNAARPATRAAAERGPAQRA